MEQALGQLDTIPIIKDITFWHILATTSCGLLIKIISKHMDKTEKTLEQVTELLNRVVAKNEIQDYKIENHEKRIERLENG